MTVESLKPASAACERSFGFLVSDYGYERKDLRFREQGFSLRYRGPVMGVLVDWYPRDPLTVWLVRLAEGEFPNRLVPTDPHTSLAYFDLGDLEAICGYERSVSNWSLYRVPDDQTAGALAESLRSCGDDLLRGDLSRIPLLEKRILDRARKQAIEHHGPETG